MQGLEGGRGPPADSGRDWTRREETNDRVFDRRAGETFNGYGYTYNRTHHSPVTTHTQRIGFLTLSSLPQVNVRHAYTDVGCMGI